MNLLLVRHGEILSNVKKVYAGRSSEGLTENGIKQAKEVAGKINPDLINSLYSSPVQRAIQTAEIIGNKIGKEVIINKYFREMEMGPWEGLSETEIANLYPEEWKVWNTSPSELRLKGRETLKELQERVLAGIRFVYNNSGKQSAVVVTHVAIIRVLLLWHAKKSLNFYRTIHIPNTGMFEIEISKYLYF